MDFLYPQALWLGLAVPAILAMYILRPRRRQKVVPSTLLWRSAAVSLQASRPWQRLQKQLLLWLQLAAAALLALGAAGPLAYWGRPSPSLIVLLDASASMQAVDVAPDRFSRAREEVLSLARSLERGATLTVIAFAGQPQVVVQQVRDPHLVEQVLRGLRPADRGNIEPALSLANSLQKQPGLARVVLVGDGGYEAEVPPDIDFIPVGGNGGNVSLAAVNLRPRGDGEAVQVAVINHGAAPAAGEVRLQVARADPPPLAWRLEPGETAYLLWPEVPSGTPIAAQLSVDTPEANALALDDQAWMVAQEARKTRALLVSEGNFFLERALSLVPHLEVYRTGPGQYPAFLAGSYDYELTILDGLAAPLPPGAVILVNPPAGEIVPGLAAGGEFSPGVLQGGAGEALMSNVDVSRVRVAAGRELSLSASWSADLTSGGRVLAAHGDSGGRRMVVLAFDLGLSDLPLRPAFPILVQNMVNWLSPPDLGLPATVQLGEEVAVNPLPLARKITVKRDLPLQLELSPGPEEVLAPPFPPAPWVPKEVGVYRLEQDWPPGGEGGMVQRVARLVAVNGYDPVEADLAVRDPRPAPEGSAPPRTPAGTQPPRSWPLAWPLAAAVLVLSLVEWGVASRGH